MIVILNNGTRIKIPDEMGQAIIQELIKSSEAAKQWHCTMNIDKRTVGGINLMQVSTICGDHDIVKEPEDLVKILDRFQESLPNKDESGKFWCQKFRQYLIELKQ